MAGLSMTLDPRWSQILVLTLFLLLGWATRDWSLRPEMVAVAIASCCATQWLGWQWLSWKEGREAYPAVPVTIQDYLSPLITSLGLALLLRVNHPATMAVAGIAAIASKFCLRVNGKHLFNPANFGIITVLCLSQQAWVSPGQWGDAAWLVALFLSAGGLVLGQVGRWDTSVTFLAAYAALEAIRNVYLGWTWDVWTHRLANGSLLLFAVFMITDPRTIPNTRPGRVIWAGCMALGTFALRNFWFVNTAVFWVLFVASLLTPLCDHVFVGSNFMWSRVKLTESSQPALLDQFSR
jgi:Na+-transporting NADH:ubiquinone oxidoreductase subunit NqrB